MGHLGHIKNEYRELVQRHSSGGSVAYPEPRDERAWQGWKEILEILYTPEEADLASRMPVMPTSLGRLAQRFGMESTELQKRLDAMCDKGLVMDLVRPDRATLYLLSPPVVGFFEFSLMRVRTDLPQKRLAEAMQAYIYGDDTFAREALGRKTVVGRALCRETALGQEDLPDVLDWERATRLIEQSRNHAVSLCYCRHKAEHLGHACNAPQEVCLSLNSAADYIIRRNLGRPVEKVEALEILQQSREHALVQIADNVQHRPAYICNCCGCCCAQLQSINRYGLHGVNPSGFRAQAHPVNCVGCGRCARTCPVAAITMHARRTQGHARTDLKAVVDGDRCIGCGVCVGACHKHAMDMQRRPQPSHVPFNTIEKAIRMAMERGKLANLLFDEGGTRGARFLHHAFKALLALPGAQRLVAQEQVSSRFIRMALSRVRDPTESNRPSTTTK